MLARKVLASVVATALAAGALTIGGQSPASAYEINYLATSKWAYTKSDEPEASFVNATVDVPVGKHEPAGAEKFKARFFFTFDLTRLNGKVVSEANLLLRERAANDCGAEPPFEVWRTEAIGSAPTWKNPPAEIEKLGGLGKGANYECANGYRVLDVLGAVNAAKQRGDSQLTLEVRVAEDAEGAVKFGRKFAYRPQVQYRANTVPVITGLELEWEKECGTLSSPTPVPGVRTARAWVSDADTQDPMLTGQFASWPVDHPDQRTEYNGAGYGNLIKADIGGNYPHGTVVAYSARVTDSYNYSEWAAPCYLVVDSVPPARAPKVTSVRYPEGGQGGGPGIPGIFVLDAEGDTDVVKYRVYNSWQGYDVYADAPAPGAAANFEFTPPYAAEFTLQVQSVDRAGNFGPATHYTFGVRHTAPEVSVEMNGIGLPSKLTFRSPIAEITHYTYSFDGGPVATVAAGADGTAVAEHTFTAVAFTRLTVTSHTADGPLGASNVDVQASDKPKLESSGYDGYYWHMGRVGEPLTVTLKPRALSIVGYQYRLNWDQPYAEVEANSAGVAVFEFTPTESAVWQSIVRGIYADGSYTEWDYSAAFLIQDPRPFIESYLYNPWTPEGGVGVSATFTAYDETGWPAEFVFTLNGGPEFAVSTEGSNTAWFELAPDRAGENVLTAQARYEDGTLSPVRVWTFLVAG